MSQEHYYSGRGIPHRALRQLPYIDKDRMKEPAGYRAGPGLVAAVDVALRLGMPLLLTGEPGIGKSRLAHSVAWELGLGEPLVFPVKSDTTGHELFYQFDAVGRFHGANERRDIDPRRFVRFNALGKAILYTYEARQLQEQLGPAFDALEHPGTPRQSVVLIDEIDKAPRDVPNDLLWEVDDMSFEIREFQYFEPAAVLDKEAPESSRAAPLIKRPPSQFTIQTADPPEPDRPDPGRPSLHPIVIITSNSEKALPEAFLRRCVYYHVPFPAFSDAPIQEHTPKDAEVSVQTVVASRLYARYQGHEPLVNDAIACFRYLRDQTLERSPGLAELLAWLDYLLPRAGAQRTTQRLKDLSLEQWLPGVAATLLKNYNDQKGMAERLQRWREQRR